MRGWQTAKADYREEQERYGLWIEWEQELEERRRELDRFWEKCDARAFERWGD